MDSDDRAAMPTCVEGEVESPTTSGDQMNQDETPLHKLSKDGIPPFSGDTNRSHLENQVDGVTDEPDTLFDQKPKTAQIARVQGIAWLRTMLNDPNGDIAEEIFKTKGFKGQYSSNERCRTVQALFTGEKAVDDKLVPYVLATWCMLGGAVPTIWKEPREKQRNGEIKPLTTWAKEILEELDQIWFGRTSGLKHCKEYGKGTAARTMYNAAEATKELDAMANKPKQDKKKPPTASSRGTSMKHAASSPRQSPATKRAKITTTEEPNEDGDLDGRNEDVEAPDQGDKQPNESDGREANQNGYGTDSSFELSEFNRDREGDETEFTPEPGLLKCLELISTQRGSERPKLHGERQGSGFEVPASSGPATSSDRPRNGSLPPSFTYSATKVLPSTTLATVQHDDRNGGRDQQTAPQNEDPSTTSESGTVNESVEDVNLKERLEKLQQQVNGLKQQSTDKDKQIEELKTKNTKLKDVKKSYDFVMKDQTARLANLQKLIDVFTGKHPEVEGVIRERNRQNEEISTLERQNTLYKADNDHLANSLVLSRQMHEKSKEKIRKLKLEAKFRPAARVEDGDDNAAKLARSVKELVKELSHAQTTIDKTRLWMAHTTVKELKRFSDDHVREDSITLEDIASELERKGMWPYNVIRGSNDT